MKEILEEYGEVLLGVLVATFIFATITLVLPMIKEVVPGFLAGLM